MKRHLFATGAVVLMMIAAPVTSAEAATVLVSASSFNPTLIATLEAGTTYDLAASGVADLFFAYNGGAGLTFDADGIPTYAFPIAPYSAFNPNGALVFQGQPGVAAEFNIGALVGTFTPGSNYFLIGLGTTITPTENVTLYALVNDNVGNFGDNRGGFTLSVETPAVPEPASWAMMIAGFGLIGGAMRRRPFPSFSRRNARTLET